MKLCHSCAEGREGLFCDREVPNDANASQDQGVPGRALRNKNMFVAPIFKEHASIDDLGQNRSANAMGDVPKAQHRSSGFFLQLSLLEILCCQLMNYILFALEELQEGQVCLGPVLDDR